MTAPVGDEGPIARDSRDPRDSQSHQPGPARELGTPAVDLSKRESREASAPSRSPAEAGRPAAASSPRRWWQRHPRVAADSPAPKKSMVREIPVLIIIALGLALLIKSFVVQPFYIPSGSMERSLLVNDRVLVNKMIYHFRDVKRGEIVVFNIEGTGFARYATPLTPPSNIVGRGLRNLENLFGLGPNNKDFIKRVIGIGGDTVACCDTQGRVTVNGIALNEPYVYRDGPDEGNRRFGPFKIAKGNLWVMGDHRNDSEDSRVGGQVPQGKVLGQAFVRVWPITKWRGYGVPQTFSPLGGGGAPGVGLLVPFLWLRRRSSRLPALPALPGRSAE